MEKKGLIFWFTGLSGSGKTTVALGVKPLLERKGFSVLVLDGDDIREKIHVKLSFSEEDIKENNRLIADMCFSRRRGYDVILVPIISPYASSRRKARGILGQGFYEIYCSADLKTVVKRDVKGLYLKAANGEVSDLIGYSDGSVYDVPTAPDLILNSEEESVEESVEKLYKFAVERMNGY